MYIWVNKIGGESKSTLQNINILNHYVGMKKIDPESIPENIAAKEITPLGNYALGISWNDGHSSGIYPYKTIQKLAGTPASS